VKRFKVPFLQPQKQQKKGIPKGGSVHFHQLVSTQQAIA
jgi:hypothetical protein